MFKTISRISACAALAVSFFLSSTARAQDLVVTIPSLNDVQTKIAAVAGKIDPTYPMLVNMTLGQAAAFGIDASKPIAIYVDFTQGALSLEAAIPVKSQKMFDAQIEKLRETGQLGEMKIESKDAYSFLLFNKDSAGAIPQIKAPKMLNFMAKPSVFLPFLEQQLAVLGDGNTENLERMKHNLEQLEKVAFSLDASQSGDMEVAFSAKPVKGTEIAENYAHTEQLTQSRLGGFFDPKAPFAVQSLGAFDENNRKDFVEAITSASSQLPEELANVILKAMEVKKFDFACSFYPENHGIYGFMGMGIANGEVINDAIVKAINDIEADAPIQGKANVDKIGEKIQVHEITVNANDVTKKVAVAVHPKYVFVAVAPSGKSAVSYLKKIFKEKGFEAAKVKHSGLVHFNMDLIAPFMKEIKPDLDVDCVGEMNYVADFANGEFNGTLKIDGSLIETIGKIYASMNEGLDDDDDLFGDDDDDDDDTTEAIAAPGDDDDDDDI